MKKLYNTKLNILLPLGFASGLPLALTGTTLQAYFTAAGIDLVTIGFLAIAGMAYVYKFLWAPLLDNYFFKFLDRRRSWIIIFQIILSGLIFSLGLFQPTNNSNALIFLAFAVAFFSASLDIVIDAYRSDFLAEKERGLGTAMHVSGYRIALLTSGGLALILADFFGFSWVFFVLGFIMLATSIATIFAPKLNYQIKTTQNLSQAFILPFKNFLQRDKAILILIFIITYKLADAFSGTLTTAFLLRGAQFSLSEVGIANKAVGLLATLIGAFWGGALMLRISMFRALFYFGILQMGSNFAFMLLAYVGHNFSLMIFSVFIENLCGGMGTAAYLAFIMSLCDKRFSASQFALLSALSAIPRVFLGPLAGVMVNQIGWLNFFFSSVFFGLPGLLVLLMLRDWFKAYCYNSSLNQPA